MEEIKTVVHKWRGDSNNFNFNPVPVVLKKGKIAITWVQHAQKSAQCMHGSHAKRKTSFCAETINKSRL